MIRWRAYVSDDVCIRREAKNRWRIQLWGPVCRELLITESELGPLAHLLNQAHDEWAEEDDEEQ
jgi:hypothetical protein